MSLSPLRRNEPKAEAGKPPARIEDENSSPEKQGGPDENQAGGGDEASGPEELDGAGGILALSVEGDSLWNDPEDAAKESPARGGDESAVQDGREDDVVEIVVHGR